MRTRRIAIGIAVLLVVAAGLYVGGAESGEVVVLRTRDAEGGVHETRLWVVDHEGAAWLRAGNPDSGWLARLRSRPEAEIVRGGETFAVRGVPDPAMRDTVNRLMAEKYGWSDRYIRLFVASDAAVPVRLDPR